ncbi:hypothetical protein Vafri_13100 [Volvox africanus]|uniref:Uncharacterized protein n=1 Tax=Volvox africanus TaxID=51714 RepID=A0A8J4BBE2_9CHLO|nr:hypothetical protein Vafri_13100 [Volvox africanus]
MYVSIILPPIPFLVLLLLRLFLLLLLLSQSTFNSTQPGQRNDWREVEGCYVLFPPSGRPPAAVAHFLGGAFVGAAPQMTYRLFLEALANRDILVVATPYSTSFDHLRIADEAQFKFDRAIRALVSSLPSNSLPTYGVGHSLGGLIHLLISARYAVQRSGNVLMSYNNRPASDVIPLLSPLIVPSARVMGPLINQLAASPIRSTVESITETVKGLSPSIVRQVLPLLEQLAPIYLDAAQGKHEFLPTPEETRMLIRTYYGIARNMLLRFKDDNMDETNNLVQLLQGSSAVGEMLDLTVRTLPGDHMRPMQQAFVDLPPEVARLAAGAVESTGGALGRLASVATQLGVQQVGLGGEEALRAPGLRAWTEVRSFVGCRRIGRCWEIVMPPSPSRSPSSQSRALLLVTPSFHPFICRASA